MTEQPKFEDFLRSIVKDAVREAIKDELKLFSRHNEDKKNASSLPTDTAQGKNVQAVVDAVTRLFRESGNRPVPASSVLKATGIPLSSAHSYIYIAITLGLLKDLRPKNEITGKKLRTRLLLAPSSADMSSLDATIAKDAEQKVISGPVARIVAAVTALFKQHGRPVSQIEISEFSGLDRARVSIYTRVAIDKNLVFDIRRYSRLGTSGVSSQIIPVSEKDSFVKEGRVLSDAPPLSSRDPSPQSLQVEGFLEITKKEKSGVFVGDAKKIQKSMEELGIFLNEKEISLSLAIRKDNGLPLRPHIYEDMDKAGLALRRSGKNYVFTLRRK